MIQACFRFAGKVRVNLVLTLLLSLLSAMVTGDSSLPAEVLSF